MSIALDIALYLRENNNNLSSSDRGILFTLAFRIGSNPFSWISQTTLAEELGMTERGLRKRISKIVEEKFIDIVIDHKDKRKNMYRPAEFLINYHLKRRESSKKYRNKSSDILEDIGTKVPVLCEDIGTKVPVNFETNVSQVIDSNEENHIENSPKATYKIKTTYKDKQKELRSVELPEWLDKSLWNDFIQHRKEMKKPMSDLAKSKTINQLSKMRDKGQNIEEVLNNSIANGWQGVFEIKPTREMTYANQQSRVKSAAEKFWERNVQGLPEYECGGAREVSEDSKDFCSSTEFLF